MNNVWIGIFVLAGIGVIGTFLAAGIFKSTEVIGRRWQVFSFYFWRDFPKGLMAGGFIFAIPLLHLTPLNGWDRTNDLGLPVALAFAIFGGMILGMFLITPLIFFREKHHTSRILRKMCIGN